MRNNLYQKILTGIALFFFLVTLLVSLSFPTGNSIYFYLLIFTLLYWQRRRLQSITSRVKNSKARVLTFLLIGWVGAIFLEFNLAKLPFSPKPLVNIFAGIGYHLPYFAFWYFLLRRYRFNFLEVFYLSGLSRLLFDALITQKLFTSLVSTSGLSLAIISLTVQIITTIVVMGTLTTVPMLLLSSAQDNKHEKPAKQYLLGLAPGFLAVGIFILWAAVLKFVFT